MSKSAAQQPTKNNGTIYSGQDREHLRSEINVRASMMNVTEIEAILRAGVEPVYNQWTDTYEKVPLTPARVQMLVKSAEISNRQIDRVIPPLKTTNVPAVLKHKPEDIEPQNIRRFMTEQVVTGQIPPDQGKLVAEVAGMVDPLSDEDETPTEFVINHVMVDARADVENGSQGSSGAQEPDLGDAFMSEDKNNKD